MLLQNLIVYENEHVILVNKPAGIPSIKTANDKSLHEYLNEYFNQKLFVVHRLDKDASGLIIFAKNSETHKYLNYQFEHNLIEKKYYAVCHGNLENESTMIKSRIKEFGSGRMGVDEAGREAITKVKLIKNYRKYFLADISIYFGRRHQIRVHLYSIGHPIVGDKLYGNIKHQKNYSRLMLHAYFIKFNLFDQKNIELQIPVAKEMDDFLSDQNIY